MPLSFDQARIAILGTDDTKAEIAKINAGIDTLKSGDDYNGLDDDETAEIDELVEALKTLTENTVVNEDFINQIEKKLKELKSKIAELTTKI